MLVDLVTGDAPHAPADDQAQFAFAVEFGRDAVVRVDVGSGTVTEVVALVKKIGLSGRPSDLVGVS